MTPGESGSVEIGPPLPADAGIGGDGTLGGSLVHLAGRFGPRTALVTPAGRWTYAELVELATTVARALLARGAAPGDHIGVLMPNSAEWVAATFGAALMGAVPVPMSVLSAVPEQEAAFTLADVRFLLVASAVGGRDLVGPLVAHNPKLAADDRVETTGDDRLPTVEALYCFGPSPAGVHRAEELLAGAATVPPEAVDAARAAAGPDGDALILFTSGTSGVPKAVLHGHTAPRLQPTVWARMQAISTDERIFSTYPFCWSSGFARSLMAALSVGACMVTIDHFEPGAALELMERERVTMAITPPTGHLDLRLIEHPDFARRDLSSLVKPANVLLAEALGRSIARSSGYGLTETFTLVTASPADHSDDAPRAVPVGPYPGGR